MRSSGWSAAGTRWSIAIEPKMRWSTKSTRTPPWPGWSSSITMRVSFVDRVHPARAAAPARSSRGAHDLRRAQRIGAVDGRRRVGARAERIQRNLPRRDGAAKRGAGEAVDEVLGGPGMTAQRPLVEHLDARHRRAGDGGDRARRARPRPREAQARGRQLPISAWVAAGSPRRRAPRPSRPASCSSRRPIAMTSPPNPTVGVETLRVIGAAVGDQVVRQALARARVDSSCRLVFGSIAAPKRFGSASSGAIRRSTSAVAASGPDRQVGGADDRLDGVGQDRRLLAAAGELLTAAEPQVAPESDADRRSRRARQLETRLARRLASSPSSTSGFSR